ncbi:FecR family protein [Maribacter sp. ACAM166]|uniref:FecR family protein n=1 Tax=Maribacter sp. ACAM166 TaxID=2508996 RepID=UPI0010FF0023|nr:FecR family protein [Maribacter sp. ACAM166]TLP80146.1 FecR family protein [Maribacter sp. ACAM166]
MTKLDIRTIITKYLSQEATTEEISILFEWVKKEGSQDVFKKFVQADFLVNYKNKSWDSEVAFEEFLQCIKVKEETKALPFYATKQVWKYAATILILITSTTYFIINRYSKFKIQPKLNSNAITLQLDSGEIIHLEHDQDTLMHVNNGLTSIHLNNGVLYQNNKEKTKNKSGSNTLKVPFGKILGVTLEDGSIIRLNSGSELTYPTSFASLDKRQVLLKGEAFFEITKNPIKPFIVKANDMYTQVFGTVFNISAYEEDDKAEVVLVEGSVGVGNEKSFRRENLAMLKPSQKVTNSKILDKSFIIEDVNVTPYISWVNGVIAFQNEQMSEIIKKLERQFNVQIINENEMLGERKFTGMFDKEGIDFILKTIQTHTHFSYTKKGRIIIIKKQVSL